MIHQLIMTSLLDATRSVNWSSQETEDNAILFWEELTKRTLTALDEWCTHQNDSTNTEVDRCIESIEHIIIVVSETKTNVSLKVLCLIIETLPSFDLLVMERKSLHFKVMGVVWKGIHKLLQGRQVDVLGELDARKVLEPCAQRMLNNVGRNKEEEKKIRTFFVAQLGKLLTEKLPNRGSALVVVAQSLVKITELDLGVAESAIVALASDPESVSIVEVISNSPMLQVYLANARLGSDSLRSVLNSTSDFHVVLASERNRQVSESPEKILEDLLHLPCAVEFAVRTVATVESIRRSPERVSLFASTWTRALVQLWIISNAEQWTDLNFKPNERLTALSHAVWSIDAAVTAETVMSYGSFSSPLSLVDWGRLSLIQRVPTANWLSDSLRLSLPATPGSSDIVQCGRAGHVHVVRALVELVSVRGLCGHQESELILSALAAMEFTPKPALEALCNNTRSFVDGTLLLRAFDVCRPFYAKVPGWSKFLCALKEAICLQQGMGSLEDRIFKELVDLLNICMESPDRLIREDTYSALADLLSVVQIPKLRELVPAKHKQDFVEFLRQERQSRVPIEKGPFLFKSGSLSDITLPGQPPILTNDSDDDLSGIGEPTIEDSISTVKKLCGQIPLEQLHDLERQLLEVIHAERSRRG